MRDEREITLYHVTPTFNAASILVSGVDPQRSRGKTKVSWWIEESMIAWALAHISARYGVAVSSMSVAALKWPVASLKRTKWRGVYTVDRRAEVDSIKSAIHYLQE